MKLDNNHLAIDQIVQVLLQVQVQVHLVQAHLAQVHQAQAHLVQAHQAQVHLVQVHLAQVLLVQALLQIIHVIQMTILTLYYTKTYCIKSGSEIMIIK